MEPDAAQRLLVKVRRFVSEELDDTERAMFAALVAPAIARIWGEEEVEAYQLSTWSPAALPEALRAALRDEGVRVVGLEL
jgi:hypothetical protein